MAKRKARNILRIILIVVLVLLASAGAFLWWTARNYKEVVSKQLPKVIEQGSDSLYHITFKDINVSIVNHTLTITGVQLMPDKKQAARMRAAHRHIPPTLSTVTIPKLEAFDIAWEEIVGARTIKCKHVVVHDLKWLLECTPRPQDSAFSRGEPNKSFLDRITTSLLTLDNPHITYHFRGPRDTFYAFLKGGKATLNDWVYNYDERIDTSVFLFAHGGVVRLDSFVFLKSAGRYTIKSPTLDFETSDNSITLKNVRAKNMIRRDPKTGVHRETYNLSFPSTELVGFNWRKLIDHNTLAVAKVNTAGPHISIDYMRENAPKTGKKGAYPSQLLLQIGMNVYLERVNIANGFFRYNEVTPKESQAAIQFGHINGHMSYVTNMDSIIARRKNCVIALDGKYNNKSDVNVTFTFNLTDTTGRYKIDGKVRNLDGKDVSDQAAVFTLVKVTSFHLNEMDMHITGDETYGKGEFTVQYQDLKISLFKFDTKFREGKKGAFKFLGSALLLYPSNPMPGKDVRRVTTSFARDTTKGFFNLIWQHMYRAAKKTAVREEEIITLTDGPETEKGEQPKKGFLKRIFGKKK